MMPNRTKLRVAMGLVVLLMAVPAFAQGIGGLQFFAPADVSPYDRGPQPNQGYFFVFDGLYWSVSTPSTKTIGTGPDEAPFDRFFAWSLQPDQTPVPINPLDWSSVDTGLFTAPFNPGQRIEFGRVEGHQGWFLSTFRLNDQTQDPVFELAAAVFKDPTNLLGTNAVFFDTLSIYNENTTWNIELNYLYRFLPFHNNGVMELFLGFRYFEFNEMFKLEGVGRQYDSTFMLTESQNHIAAPQIGVRLFKKFPSRFMISAEGRFFEGYNSLNAHQWTKMLSTDLGISNSTSTHQFSGRWNPAVEARFDFRYQMTRSISARVGWTGMWIDGIARASHIINYEIPIPGIRLEKREGLFIHGITAGIDINR
jgi:hypothetical protein